MEWDGKIEGGAAESDQRASRRPRLAGLGRTSQEVKCEVVKGSLGEQGLRRSGEPTRNLPAAGLLAMGLC